MPSETHEGFNQKLVIDASKKEPTGLSQVNTQIHQALEKNTRLSFSDLQEASKWNESQKLPPNPDLDKPEDYLKVDIIALGKEFRGAYNCVNYALKYASQHPEKKKFNFIDETPNIGWKTHINVPLAHVPQVAAYLTEHGYYHKYLEGGEVGDGKIFTIYFGDKSLIDKWIPIISKDIGDCFVKPTNQTEVELSKGIVGRFACREKNHESYDKYTPYGAMGMPLLKESARGLGKKELMKYLHNPTLNELETVYGELVKDFGTYFTGGE